MTTGFEDPRSGYPIQINSVFRHQVSLACLVPFQEGRSVVAMDLKFHPQEQDILSDVGYANMVFQVLNLKPSVGGLWCAPVCSTWSWMCPRYNGISVFGCVSFLPINGHLIRAAYLSIYYSWIWERKRHPIQGCLTWGDPISILQKKTVGIPRSLSTSRIQMVVCLCIVCYFVCYK